MGMFDDLIPSSNQPTQTAPAAGGMFDDLIPQETVAAAQSDPVAGVDFSRPIEELRPELAKLPEDQRKQALDKWADTETARIAKVAGVPSPSPARGTAIGSFLDEAAAAATSIPHYLTGGMVGKPYDEELALQRARQRATEAAHPVASTVSNIAGGVGTAAATPMVKVMQGASALPTAVNMGVTGGAYSALYGYGEGEGTQDRLQKATQGLATGTLVGAPLGAVTGHIVSKGAPAAGNSAVAAAQRVGIDLPIAAAGGDTVLDRGKRAAAAALGGIPMVGAPIPHAAGKAVDQISDAVTRTADAFAPGASHAGAGDAAKSALTDWIKVGSAKVMQRLHDDVSAHIPKSAFRPLSATRQAVDNLGAADIASASTVNQPAINMVQAALDTPGGLSFDGLMRLRTNVGAMIDDGLLPAAGTTKPALKQIYSGLTKDLDAMAFTFGGRDGAKAWAKATKIDKMIADRRESLTKIIGSDGMKSGESTVDAIMRMAGTNSTADIGKLKLARKAIGSDAWDEVSSSIIPRLGRNQADEFSPARFLTRYSALNDDARNVLFGSTGKGNLKADLDDLAAVSTKLKNLDQLRNSSNTGAVVGLLTLSGYTLGGLPLLLAKAATGHVIARILAHPAKVKQVTRFGNALYQAATRTAPQVPGKAQHTVTTGEAILQPAIMSLARTIAEESGESEEEAAARINSALRGR
jgi:hypothetical protein